MTIAETAPGTSFTRSARRHRLPGDMAVHPFHGIGGGERQDAREHLVKRDAERVEIAAGIDRAVHPSGLLGRHVGERAGDGLGRLGRLAFARQARGDAEAGEPDFVGSVIRPGCWRLDVFVDEAALVKLAREPRRCRSRGARTRPTSMGAPSRRSSGSPPGSSSTSMVRPPSRYKLQRPHRPGTVELILQGKFMSETINNGGMRALRDGPNRQYPTGSRGCPNAVIGRRPDPRPPIGLGGRRAPHSGTEKSGSTPGLRHQEGKASEADIQPDRA